MLEDGWPIIAGLFAFAATISSLWHITKHLVYFNKPYLQKYIVRILWMVPIYSLNSWIALVLPSTSVYLDVCRETYEAFVVYSFMRYLFNYLHYDLNIQQTVDFKPGIKHPFPLCFLGTTSSGRLFLHRCRHGILQYVVVRPLTTLFAVVSQIVGAYGEGQFNLGKSYIYLLVVNNISQMLAMYCLVIFYTSYKMELANINPLSKFLCIKLVVFFSFFQSVLITFIVHFLDLDADQKLIRSRSIQEILVCIEMLFASIGHHYAYSYQPFIDSPLQDASESCCFSFLRTLDFKDESHEVFDHIYQVMLQFKKKFKSPRSIPHVFMVDHSQSEEAYECTPLTAINLTNAGSSKSSYSALPSLI